ncbi:hypothetical protein CK203_037083 [Vitis vinifera]|uniref:Uncharacterized protein n=1 Tax=Vitis vinifera TaxID=29760 RepID=A0A438I5X8_VITVI|nr:hypothetical protein CK203_037083 [Vitis vinifera]
MYIKTKYSVGIRGSIEQHENVRELLKAIDEQFVTSNKALASTLIMMFTSLKLTGIRGVREHVMEMRDIVAQLKKLEGEMFESFLCTLSLTLFRLSMDLSKSLTTHIRISVYQGIDDHVCSRERKVNDGARRKCYAGDAKEMKERKISSQSEREATNFSQI